MGTDYQLFPGSVDLLVPLGTPYLQGSVHGDDGKGTVWDIRDVVNLRTGTVERFVERRLSLQVSPVVKGKSILRSPDTTINR